MLRTENIRLIAPYQVKGIKSTGLWEIESYIKNKVYIAIDCETDGLDPFTNKIVMLQLGDHNRQFVIDTRFQSAETFDYLYNLLKEKILIGQNIKFDLKQFKHHYSWNFRRVFDVMITEKLLNNNKKDELQDGFYGLASIASRYLGVEFNPAIKTKKKKGISYRICEQGSLFPEISFSKSVRDEFSKIGNKSFTAQQIIYGSNDIWMPYLIRKKQLVEVRKQYMQKLIALENEYTIALADIELNGIKWLEEPWMRNYNSYLEKEDEAKAKLKEIRDINWNSSKQVSTYFKELEIPIKVLDKKKSYGEIKFYKDSVQATHIKKFAGKWDIIDTYLSYKGLQKLTSSYGEKFAKHVHPVTNRIHSNYMQLVTTGRMSSSKVNMQQIPGKEDCTGFRECFVPEEGNTFVMADYSSQESVILADMSQDKAMVEFFNGAEKDMHAYTARKMFKVNVSKKENPHLRQRGKVLNFMIPYGGGPFKLAEQYQIPLKEAEEFIKLYYETYSGLKSYFERGHKNAFKRGYILTDEYYKRRVYIKDYEEFKNLHNWIEIRKLRGQSKIVPKKVWSRYYTLKGGIERDSQNYPIQSLAASMTKLAIVMFHRWAIDAKMNAKIVLVIHDEIGVECDKKIATKVSKALRYCMEGAGKIVLPNNLIKIKANPVITDYWKHD